MSRNIPPKPPNNSSDLADQVIQLRNAVKNLTDTVRQDHTRKRMQMVPVKVSELMKGFQSAVAKANRAAQTQTYEGEEDIEPLIIKNMSIKLSSNIIDQSHSEDPILMLPNIKSIDPDVAQIELKFDIVTVPKSKGQE